MEKAVHKRLYDFCETPHILYDNQYGFRPKHSTMDAVSKCSAHVMPSLEDNLTTLAVFLDLSKAFDTIDHNIPLGGVGVRLNILIVDVLFRLRSLEQFTLRKHVMPKKKQIRAWLKQF